MENNILTGTPRELAYLIFKSDPRPPLSNQLYLDETDNEFIFQVLLNIFLNGLLIKESLIRKTPENKYSLVMTEDMFIKFKLHFRSIGFDINYKVKEFNEYVSLTDDDYKYSYCRIYVKEDFNFIFGVNLNFYKRPIKYNDKINLDKFVATFEDSDLLYCINFSYFTGD